MNIINILKKIYRKFIKPKTLSVLPEDIHIRLSRFQQQNRIKRLLKVKRPKDFESKIEIIIPCFNHGKYLNDAIGSIRRQTLKTPLTVTLINDKSSDDSLKIMEQIKRKNSEKWIKIKIIDNKTNLNQWASINKAIEKSNNELFIELDADDILTPDCLELILYTYKKYPKIGLLGAQSIWFKDGERVKSHKIREHDGLNLTIYGPKEAVNFKQPNDLMMSHTSMSFFKSTWKAVGGYRPLEERVFAQYDRDFQMRACSILPIGSYLNYQTMFYRINSSQNRGTY